MKFVRYQIGERASYGIWEGASIHEISGSIFGKFETTSARHKISEVRLLPPAEPSKILCVGLNFRDHVEELGDPIPKFPSHFIKPLSAVIGPEDPILYPRVAQRVDYEGELALVIKNRVKDVSPEEALDRSQGKRPDYLSLHPGPLGRLQTQTVLMRNFILFFSSGVTSFRP